jgi:hypothetical protein
MSDTHLPKKGATSMSKTLFILALCSAFALAGGPVRADSPSGAITIQLNSLDAIANMGVNWVGGILTSQGQTRTFKMKGLKPAIAGVRNLSVQGEVYNLHAAPDLAGNYRKAVPTVSTSILGEKNLIVQNDKGVVINIRVTKKRLLGKMRTLGEVFKREGVPLVLAPEGLTIDQVQ